MLIRKAYARQPARASTFRIGELTGHFPYVSRIVAEPLTVVRGFRIHQVGEGWAESTHTQIHCETSSAQQPRYSVKERYEVGSNAKFGHCKSIHLSVQMAGIS